MNNFFKNEYGKCWDFIKGSRRFIYGIIIVFLVLGLIGFFVPFPEALTNEIMNYIQKLLEKTKDFNVFEMTGFIFLNNFKASLIGMILGVFVGIFPLINAISNGAVLGLVSRLSVNEQGLSSLWKLFPHGIFELPAIFISLGLGMKIGSFVFEKKKIKALKHYVIESLRVFVFVILPLLIIAAIIEGFLIFAV
jgi:stage II sporulation protein M